MITTVPRRLGSNATTEELIAHIRHTYPNLGPVLSQVVERLEELLEEASRIKELEAQVAELICEAGKLEHKCPQCGFVSVADPSG